jgi:bis(5'-nucleosyl)-tetraphosphatase (symmetrical)
MCGTRNDGRISKLPERPDSNARIPMGLFAASTGHSMSTYAVGDIQGCFDQFSRLLDVIRFDRAHDRLWLVGDLVNRGPRSLEVLRVAKGLGDAAIVVLGNHDLHLLALSHGHAKARSDDTLEAVLKAPDRDELLQWLRHRPMMHVETRMAMVHAGLLPQWTIATAAELAGEVEAALRGPDHDAFIAALYGGKPDHWDESLRGYDRLRVIVNAMTRLRFCTLDGVMDFHAKGETESAPPGFVPWFDVPGRRSADTTLVCGHWSALGLHLRTNLLALDSGCVWGGKLTAVRLEDRAQFQVACGSG